MDGTTTVTKGPNDEFLKRVSRSPRPACGALAPEPAPAPASTAVPRRRDDGRRDGPARRASTAARARAGLTINDIYQRSNQGVVDITVRTSGGSQLGQFGGSQSSQAEGSGFVYDARGDIITNEHVVDGATSITVTFGGRQELHGARGRQRQLDRPRGDQDLGARVRAPSAHARRLVQRRGRRRGGRDRQPLRPRRHGHERHHQRAAPEDPVAEQLHDRRRDPDRRADQPRQLRRPAARRRGPRDRRQLADPERLRRQRRRRLRDPVEHRRSSIVAADRRRQERRARLPRRPGRGLELAGRREAGEGAPRHAAAKAGLKSGDVVTKLDGKPSRAVATSRPSSTASGPARSSASPTSATGQTHTTEVTLGARPA